MDFLSVILAAIGWQKDQNNKVSDRRIEAYRLNAEIAAEAAQCIVILSLASPDILRRVTRLFPDQPAVLKSCTDTLATIRSQAEQLHAMAENYKTTIEKASAWTDWDKIVRKLHEWKSTSSMLRPYVEAIVKKYEDLLRGVEQTESSFPGSPSPRLKDRGWDSPPL